MVYSTQDGVSYNPTAARNPMPMFVRRDWNIDWRIGDAWPKTAVGPTSIVMFDPLYCDFA